MSIISLLVKLYILTTTPWFDCDIIQNNLLSPNRALNGQLLISILIIKSRIFKQRLSLIQILTHCYFISFLKIFIHVWSYFRKKKFSTNLLTSCYINLLFFLNLDLRNPTLVYAISFITTIKSLHTLRQIFMHNYISLKQFPIHYKRCMYLILFQKQTDQEIFYYGVHFS